MSLLILLIGFRMKTISFYYVIATVTWDDLLAH